MVSAAVRRASTARGVAADRGQLGGRLDRGAGEAVRALERRPQRVRDGQPGRRRVGRDLGPVVEDRRGVGEHRLRLVEPPRAHRIAQRPRQQPVPGFLDHLVVLGACGATGVEQRQVRVARDPRPPQVVVRDAGPFLEEVEQGTPVGRRVNGLGRGRRRRRRRTSTRCRSRPAGTPRPSPRRLPRQRAGRRNRHAGRSRGRGRAVAA